MKLEERLLIICNPTANNGMAKTVLNAFNNFLLQESYHSCFVFETRYAMDTEGIQSAMRVPHDVVVIIGGDGTLYDCMNSIEQPSKERFIYFPAGSGNDFARCFYGSLQASTSYFNLLQNRVWRKIDLGVCNGMRFLNGVGAGFDGYVASRAQQGIAGKLKGAAKYKLAVLQGIARFPSQRVQLIIDGFSVLDQSAFMVSIGNGDQFGGGYMLVPGAQMNDGLLDVIVIPRISALQRLRYLPRVKSGDHVALPFVLRFQGKEIRMEYNQEAEGHVDGQLVSNVLWNVALEPEPLTFADFTQV